ncbi:TetR/AcrR family transcriptional regulator [Chroococcidiopsis sp.]|uniref:TetR/AcrR family transcriptional regulator n=1 Tax=Chroococcidiopsis sp. TaxID=3088168 RepID=UPI003F40E5B8
MTRDKEETKARILAAVGKLLAASGFRQLGINAIAREAQVDKVLIYRYFGSLPELLRAFGKKGDYWINAEELIDNGVAADSWDEEMVRMLLQLSQDLQERPITQEILRWELLEGNELTEELAQIREQTAIACLDYLRQNYPTSQNRDLPAIGAVLIAGIVYLTLRSRIHSSFLGIDLTSPTGWQRIEAAIRSMVQATVEGESGVGRGGFRNPPVRESEKRESPS